MYTNYNIAFEDFNLSESQFDHPSRLHGIMHTYRVMLHVLRLGRITGNISEARNAFFAAYIHDMARKHDGYCNKHGTDAANNKLLLYKDLFIANGATENDLLITGKATSMHSVAYELPKSDRDWLTVAILKDADALDRIRLGEGDLNKSYLRLTETESCIDYSRNLYFKTVDEKPADFIFMLSLSGKL
ncbi:MAG: hypothetical protein K0B15_16100 [Lentimicrobium sp.]|nr:hypothetical protein [Lentimicrobium sp.]